MTARGEPTRISRCAFGRRWLYAILMGFVGALPVVSQQAEGVPDTLDEAERLLSTGVSQRRYGRTVLQAIGLVSKPAELDRIVSEYIPRIRPAPVRSRAMYEAGLIYELANRYQQARTLYARAVDADAANWAAALRGASLALESAEYAEAELLLTRIIRRAPDRELQRQAAIIRTRSYLLSGSGDRALAHAQSLAGWTGARDERTAEAPPVGWAAGIEPTAAFLLREVAEAVGDAQALSWAEEGLRRYHSNTPEAQMVGTAEEDRTVTFFPSPSRILGGVGIRTPVSVRQSPRDEAITASEPGESEDSDTATVEGVQTGSFRDEENARYMADDLGELGFEAVVRRAETGNRTFYRVLVPVGPNTSAEAAQETVVALKERGIEGFLIFND